MLCEQAAERLIPMQLQARIPPWPSYERSCTMLKKVRHCRETSLARPFWSWPIPEVLWKLCEALCEAVAAHRRYEWLRSRGVPHNTALRDSIGHSACECHATDRGPRESATKPVRHGAASIGVLSYVK
jgi:hypothetical protein